MVQWTFHNDGHWWDDLNNLRDDDAQLGTRDADVVEDIMFDDYCACGSPGILIGAMIAYLRSGRTISEGRFPHVDTDLDLAMAYWADRRGFTEHGGSVYGAWITDAGSRWLELVDNVEVA